MRQRAPRMVYSSLLKLPTNISQKPSWCGARGGLNLQLISQWARAAVILMVFHFSSNVSCNSFSAPTKSITLSGQIKLSVPRREAKSLYSHCTRSIVHGRDDFHTDNTGSHGWKTTSEEKFLPLLGSLTNCNTNKLQQNGNRTAKVINPGVSEGMRLIRESLFWEQ